MLRTIVGNITHTHTHTHIYIYIYIYKKLKENNYNDELCRWD
jgi:hypothetical protein